jgi:Zn-dependent peptidase ImmA (M78 family)
MSENNVPYRKREAIEAEAEKLLREHGIDQIPVDPIRIAKSQNVRIFNATFNDNSISGVLTRRGPNITMLINANDSAFRKRFTIAHELAHHQLKHFSNQQEHTDKNKDLYRLPPKSDTEGSDREEIQANMFAAALLMPATFVKAAYKDTQDVDELARRFQVSSEAMGNRLASLGLL